MLHKIVKNPVIKENAFKEYWVGVPEDTNNLGCFRSFEHSYIRSIIELSIHGHGIFHRVLSSSLLIPLL